MSPSKLLALSVFAFASIAAPPPLTYSGTNPRVQNPLPPEASAQHVQVPEGFSCQLFAAEPDIVNPIAMAWDHRGRLFVLQSVDYPHEIGGDSGNDRITICEDRNGDGRAETFTLFAEKLSLATGIVCVDKGVIVCQAPNMVRLTDTDGDERADKSDVLFGGFGLRDTHAGPSNIFYGLDNYIWGSVGYSGFNGLGQQLNKGVFRFSLDGKVFEPIATFNNNTWGAGISESFDIFGSTANNNHCVYVGIPLRFHAGRKGKQLFSVANIQGHYEITTIAVDPLQQVDVRGGYTSAAGANIYTARSFPESYWNQVMFVNEPTGHVVHSARLVPDGAGFKEVDGGNIFASSDNWCAPVYSDVGPDGQLWIADWYNPVIQHNADQRGMPNQIWNANRGVGNAHINPLRDRKHGRIYRVSWDAAPATTTPQLKTSADLVQALRHDNMFWRKTAQRLLVEGKREDAIPALRQLAVDDNAGFAALHALWTLHGLGAADSATAAKALAHPHAAVRRAAAQTLPATPEGSRGLAASKVLVDSNEHTRLAAILRASELPDTPELAAALIAAGEVGMDKWLVEALTIAGANPEAPDIGPSQPLAIGKAQWRYSFKVPPESWTKPEFDDSGWKVGQPGFGTQGTPNTTIGTVWNSTDIWLRKHIKISANIANPYLKIHHDEDYQLYINGIAITQDVGYTTDYEIRPLQAAARTALHPGDNIIAVHCRQTRGGQYIDFELVSMPSIQPKAAAADRVIHIKTVRDKMAFDLKEVHAFTGERLEVIFENPDHMPHNLVFIKGDLEAFGAVCDAFMLDPKAVEKEYVPDSPAVLAWTAMLDPERKVHIRFQAPDAPGDYPFVCTFPGHWRLMHGVLRVTAAIETVMMGGGSSHDFKRWYQQEDSELLSAQGARVHYSEDTGTPHPKLADSQLLFICNNKPFSPIWREAIVRHVEAGKPLMINHPSTWYNWKDWPEYNRELVGGGSRSHENLQAFDVVLTQPEHPILNGVPKTFEIVDELYRLEFDAEGSPVGVLAIGRSKTTGKEYPVVWIVKHPKARIVCNTLGHDARAHELPAYRTLLVNSMRWALKKP